MTQKQFFASVAMFVVGRPWKQSCFKKHLLLEPGNMDVESSALLLQCALLCVLLKDLGQEAHTYERPEPSQEKKALSVGV